MYHVKAPKKLIEVALPLDDINDEASLRKRKAPAGYPTALHKWWAQRPPAAARAVLFAQLVNDPGYETGQGFTRGVNKKEAARERERLFDIIRKLVLWENTNNETVLNAAREEIGRAGARPALSTLGIQERMNYSTRMICLISMTLLVEAVQSRWRRSGSD